MQYMYNFKRLTLYRHTKKTHQHVKAESLTPTQTLREQSNRRSHGKYSQANLTVY